MTAVDGAAVRLDDPIAVVDELLAQRWCVGAQLVVSVGGRTALEYVAGTARPDVPLTQDTKVRLDCAGKPVLALAVAALADRGEIDLHAPVASVIPEFGTGGKAEITPHHLLTHTAGWFRPPDLMPYRVPLAELKQRLFAQPRKYGPPGTEAGYDAWGGWYVLAELLTRTASQPWYDVVEDVVLKPAGLSGIALFPQVDDGLELPYRWHQDRYFPIRHLLRPEMLEYENPGFGGYASMRSMVAFYEILSDGERCRAVWGVSPDVVVELKRPRMLDKAINVIYGTGYGVRVDLRDWHHPLGTSAESFGHQSDGGVWAFADPAHELVVGLRLNGIPFELFPNPNFNDRVNPVLGAVYRTTVVDR
jgi:CubicO group peptidase (beta-lactamase class C family)